MRTSVRLQGSGRVGSDVAVSDVAVTPPWSAHWRAGENRRQPQMAAITFTSDPRLAPRRIGPTTRPRGASRAVSRAVYLRRRVTAVVLGMALVLVMAQAGAALGGSSLAAPERSPASTHPSTIVRPGDSLWPGAPRLAPGEAPRPGVGSPADGRQGAPLTPGERVEWGG